MLTHHPRRLAGALATATAAISLGYGASADATVIATLTEVGSNPITISKTSFISCSSCIASGLATYDFAAGASLFGFTGPAAPYMNGYDSEGFTASGGTLSITNGSENFLTGSFSSGTAYAVLGSTSATVELDLTGASSNVLSVPTSGALYFDLTGTTPATVGLNSKGDFTIGGLDWTATLSTSPFTPASAVPLPATVVLLMSGLVLLAAVARSRRAAASKAALTKSAPLSPVEGLTKG